MANGRSSLANGFSGRAGAAREGTVYGVAVHTTGSGVVDAAAKKGRDPLDYTVHVVYENPDNFCAHYVVGWDGTIWQVMDETLRAQHIGFMPNDRESFLDGSWVDEISNKEPQRPNVPALWSARWPSFKSPAHLFPGPSPNQVYVGIEMIPLTGAAGQPAPLISNGVQRHYTEAQHSTVAKLIADIAARWNLPDEIWSATSGRLVGHEDVNPLERSVASGGWDPGALRAVPQFDWDYVRAQQPQPIAAATTPSTNAQSAT